MRWVLSLAHVLSRHNMRAAPSRAQVFSQEWKGPFDPRAIVDVLAQPQVGRRVTLIVSGTTSGWPAG